MKNVLGISLILLLLSSCIKYDDGPTISFLSKEKRLTRKWTLEQINHSNGYSSEDFFFTLNFGKDKSLQIEHKNSAGETISTSSTWDWHLSTYGLTLNLGSHPQGLPSGTRNFEIKRLTRNELW
ncbi:MAG: hypothetical protein ACKN86_09505, partial [Crocinitomicaceae bacterium]